MGLVEELLGCSLLEITRSYWAVKLNTGEWLCEARIKVDLYNARERHFDWSNDLVAGGDVRRIAELWLLCPASRTSPFGNTARLVITEPGTAFQFKVATVDSSIAATSRQATAHIIGKVTNKETGDCDCFIWDEQQQGLITPETMIYDPITQGAKRNKDGTPVYAGKNNVYDFHSWNPRSVAHLGRLELRTLGVRL